MKYYWERTTPKFSRNDGTLCHIFDKFCVYLFILLKSILNKALMLIIWKIAWLIPYRTCTVLLLRYNRRMRSWGLIRKCTRHPYKRMSSQMRMSHHHEFYEYFLVWHFLYQHFRSKWQNVSEKYKRIKKNEYNLFMKMYWEVVAKKI